MHNPHTCEGNVKDHFQSIHSKCTKAFLKSRVQIGLISNNQILMQHKNWETEKEKGVFACL